MNTLNHPDAMIHIAVERQAERVRRVRAYKSSTTLAVDERPTSRWTAFQVAASLIVVLTVVGLLVSVAH